VKERLLDLRHNRWARVLFGLAMVGAVAGALWFGPDWHAVGDSFQNVEWQWVAVAIAINLASIVSRAVAWDLVIRQAHPNPPLFRHVFSAFSVGMLANAVLPGRIGELARVGVLTRHTSRRKSVWATLAGTVVAHRMFDLIPICLLVLYVLVTAKIPAWAYSIIVAVVSVGATLFVLGVLSARSTGRHQRLDGVGAVRRALHMAREGLAVMHKPVAALGAIFFQTLGWVCQLFAVFTAMRAFDIHEGVPAAALVLLVMNVATIIPLWPGNVGAVQVAIAIPLVSYGVAYADGIAFGFGLQAIEASVGIGLGLIFLAREGLSFATLRRMPAATDTAFGTQEAEDPPATEAQRERARVPG
jgi:uncharacterized protein (TIRG00374 family)